MDQRSGSPEQGLVAGLNNRQGDASLPQGPKLISDSFPVGGHGSDGLVGGFINMLTDNSIKAQGAQHFGTGRVRDIGR
jgi:hypothetical protein